LQAVLKSKNWQNLGRKLVNIGIIPGMNVQMNISKENLDIIDHPLNMKYFLNSSMLSCPNCEIEFDSKEERLDHMLQKYKRFMKIEEKHKILVIWQFCTEYCFI
jgi:hypothetical protein